MPADQGASRPGLLRRDLISVTIRMYVVVILVIFVLARRDWA